MTKQNRLGPTAVCPACGAPTEPSHDLGDLAWVRQLAAEARREGGPVRAGEARQLLDDLFSLPPRKRSRRIESEPRRYTSRLLVTIALEGIESHFPREPRRALEELETVQALVALLDDPPEDAASFRTAALLTCFAYRAAGALGISDLYSASFWTGRARDLAGSREVLDGFALALLDEQEGRVRLYQRRLSEAEELLAGAARQFLSLGDEARGARALLNLAEVQRRDSPEEALATLAAATERIDPYASPYVYLCCQMERALVLCELGEGLAVELLLEEYEPVIREFESIPSVPLRAAWLRGRAALQRGQHDRAVDHLETARRRALESRDLYDAALVSLDLALVHLDRGDLDALRAEAQAVIPILTAEGLHDAAAAALSLYRDALLHQHAGRALIHRLKSYFETAPMMPGYRFRAVGESGAE